ncbi:DUF742 domain-containing protein [Streptomyces sp. NPDC059894]|uniref:DUF742 domain-containing protein n=1 Tax=unclassified Streptomyces TaxID=2593676 RepID=UPI0036531066
MTSGESWAVVPSLDVRPYAVAGGRTDSRNSSVLHLDTVLEPGNGQAPALAPPEAHTIFRLCSTRRRSIAELAGTLRCPVPVIQVLVSDLLDHEALFIPSSTYSRDRAAMQAVLAGLRRMWPDAQAG